MSNMASGILGVAAAFLALGAVHLEVAAGNDLLGPSMTVAARTDVSATLMNVDRSAKGDRAAAVSPAGGTTLSYNVPGTPDASIMMRVPAGAAADALRKSPVSTGKGSSAGTRPVACEPVVSVLTDVAKQLAPGRCVT